MKATHERQPKYGVPTTLNWLLILWYPETNRLLPVNLWSAEPSRLYPQMILRAGLSIGIRTLIS